MNLTRCNNGHFYDADKYKQCPHCIDIDKLPIIPNPETEIMYDLKLIKKGIKGDKDVFLRGNHICVGKDTNQCPIILDSIYGSKLHAKFVCEEGVWNIIDTNSTNGTTVNGRQIETNKLFRLNNNDEIAFSPSDIFVFIDKRDEKPQYCYNCGHIVKNYNNPKTPVICEYCNESQEIEDKDFTMLICDSCYTSNMTTDNFCRGCGKPLKTSVINKLDYYICVYTESWDGYFNHNVKCINILANGQMTNSALRINIGGEGILFLLNADKDDEIKISTIFTSGQYKLFSGFHKETITDSFVLDKANAYDYYSGFGRMEKKRLYYIISKKTISPKDIIGECIQKYPNIYLSKEEFVDCLSDVVEQLNTFVKQIKKESPEFNYHEFDELINGKTVSLKPVLFEPTDKRNNCTILLSEKTDDNENNTVSLSEKTD